MKNFKQSNQAYPAKRERSGGFTLLEILLVVGIIALLAGIVIMAVNPAKQLAQVRNAERKSDIKQIDSAITQYYIDNFEYPDSITTSDLEVCDTGDLTSAEVGDSCDGLADLSSLVPLYVTAIPTDPQASTANGAGYTVKKNAAGKLISQAPLAELEQFIAIGIATTTVGGGESSGTLGDGLVAHYKMNDNDLDSLVATAYGSINGLASFTTSDNSVVGKINNALTFNGSSDLVDLSSHVFTEAELPTGTVSLWAKFGDVNTYSVYYEMYGVVSLMVDSGSLFCGLWDGDWHPIYSLGPVETGVWYNIIFTWNGSEVKLYLDNVLQGTNFGGVPQFDSYNGRFVGLGVDWSGGTGFFNGILDDVRLYSRVLTQDEIAELAAGTEAE